MTTCIENGILEYKFKHPYFYIPIKLYDNPEYERDFVTMMVAVFRYAQAVDFKITKKVIQNATGFGDKKFNRYWKMGKDYGYIKQVKEADKNNKGQFIYHYDIFEEPNVEETRMAQDSINAWRELPENIIKLEDMRNNAKTYGAYGGLKSTSHHMVKNKGMVSDHRVKNEGMVKNTDNGIKFTFFRENDHRVKIEGMVKKNKIFIKKAGFCTKKANFYTKKNDIKNAETVDMTAFTDMGKNFCTDSKNDHRVNFEGIYINNNNNNNNSLYKKDSTKNIKSIKTDAEKNTELKNNIEELKEKYSTGKPKWWIKLEECQETNPKNINTQYCRQEIKKYLDKGMSEELVIAAINDAMDSTGNDFVFKYLRTVLVKYETHPHLIEKDIETPAEKDEKKEPEKAEPKKKSWPKKKSTFTNYKQREYTQQEFKAIEDALTVGDECNESFEELLDRARNMSDKEA